MAHTVDKNTAYIAIQFLHEVLWYFIDNSCKLYSAVLSKHWPIPSINPIAPDLESYKCYSSWVDPKHPNLAETAIVTASATLDGHKFEYANDGYFCDESHLFSYSSRFLGAPWIQVCLVAYVSWFFCWHFAQRLTRQSIFFSIEEIILFYKRGPRFYALTLHSQNWWVLMLSKILLLNDEPGVSK